VTLVPGLRGFFSLILILGLPKCLAIPRLWYLTIGTTTVSDRWPGRRCRHRVWQEGVSMPRVLMSRAGQDREALNRELARVPRDVTTAITWCMKQQGVNKAELARAMGVTPGRVSQILSGDGNLTLHTLAAVCAALDARLNVELVPHRGNFLPDEGYPRSSASPENAAPPVAPPVVPAAGGLVYDNDRRAVRV
jgi:transcriptional regulator with XRE-family HTH domain